MQNQMNSKSATRIEWMCVVLFSVFSILFLGRFQPEVLWYSQHVLSHGATEYSAFIGTPLLTAVALVLRFFVVRFMPAHPLTPALSFLPSALLLALITDIHPVSATAIRYGSAWWQALIVGILFVGIVRLLRKARTSFHSDEAKSREAKMLWQNLAVLSLVCFLAAAMSNTDRRDHQPERYDEFRQADSSPDF